MLVLMLIVILVTLIILPILVVLLLNDIEHGDDVHRLQQLVPVLLVHVTDIAIDAFVIILMMMIMMIMMMTMK